MKSRTINNSLWFAALLVLCARPDPAAAQHEHHDPAASAHAQATGAAALARTMPPHDFLWLADSPPTVRRGAPAGESRPTQSKHGSHQEHNSGVENAVADTGERTMNHAGAKRLWLRTGADPVRSDGVAIDTVGASLRMLGADGTTWEVAPAVDQGGYHAQIAPPETGFYNAYLTLASLTDGRLDAQVAKAEVLRGTCCKKGIDPLQERAIDDPTQPIELVRDHMPDEKLFTKMVSGDTVTFTVHSFGAPLPGATVTLATQQGWKKTVVSGPDGRVRFTLIRDYFPSWEKFWRLNKQTFLVTAEAEAGPGSWQGQPFRTARLRTTLAGKYSPAPTDYRSYALGLGISIAVVLFLGTAIYLYRRRRVKPFREVRFDEKA